MNRGALFLLVLFVLMGPTPLVVGAIATWMEWSEHREQVQAQAGWADAEARVVSCSSRGRDPRTGSFWYQYEAEWTDQDGRTHRSAGGGGSCIEGRRYPIRYNPADPEQTAAPVGWFFPVPIILCLIGLGFTSIGVKEWLKARRAEPPDPSPPSS